uniref:ABC transporter family G domain-containing protein n=1 Tax=Megaselia scalaris TaxID=36166 RepID=T1GF17_MEGSC
MFLFSGLDSSSCSQCVSLLKMLAKQGHTIVCTIHQPSALIFEMFDKLYTVVDGNCMYQGPTRELIPFLADQGLHCPSYHNPADFLMEVAVGEYERDLNKLINAANKKYYEDSDLYHLSNIRNGIRHVTDHKDQEKKTGLFYKLCGNNKLSLNFNTKNDVEEDPETCESLQPKKGQEILDMEKLIQPASFIMQYFLLLNRLLIGVRRSYFLLIARIVAHVVIGTIFGYLYMNVGTKATTVLGNYVYFYGTVLLLVYMGKMAVVMT